MPLKLRVVSYHAPAMGAAAVREFDQAGGVIGRAAGSDWTLPDPDKYVSSSHCQIHAENGRYFLSDTSTNGTFLNDPQGQPVGRGAPVPLNDGDRLFLGEYEIVVSLEPTVVGAATTPPSVPGYVTGRDDPFQAPAAPADFTGSRDDPFAMPSAPVDDPFGATAADVDPLAALDKASGQRTGPTSGWSQTGPQMADQGPVIEDHFDVPSPRRAIPDNWDRTSYEDQPQAPPTGPLSPDQPGGGIPENWDKTSFGSQDAPASPVGLEPAPDAPIPQSWDQTSLGAGPPAPEQPVTTPSGYPPGPGVPEETKTVQRPQIPMPPGQPGEADLGALQLLLEGAGIDPARVPPEATNYVIHVSGQIIHEVVKGMMEVLTARATLKNEFRISLTTLQPVQNNPLKFSVNIDAAMEALLLHSGQGYLQPVEAVREGFDDIRAHQIAMLAGMRAAFNSLLERFSPEELAAQFGSAGKASLLGSKGRNWERYVQMMERFAADPDTSFRELFGDEFARAYEEQMNQLSGPRR